MKSIIKVLTVTNDKKYVSEFVIFITKHKRAAYTYTSLKMVLLMSLCSNRLYTLVSMK